MTTIAWPTSAALPVGGISSPTDGKNNLDDGDVFRGSGRDIVFFVHLKVRFSDKTDVS